MFRVVELLYSRRVPHVAVLALMSIGFAGCSGDMSTRLSENPFSNPFASQPEATASVPSAPVERRELPQYARPQSPGQSSAPAIAAPQSYPTASAGSSGGGRGVTSYAAPGQPLETTGSAAPRSVAANRGSGQGGTKIIVGTSDTLDTLSRRYNVSPAAILQANGLDPQAKLKLGTKLTVPGAKTAAVAPAAQPAAAAQPATALAPPATKIAAATGEPQQKVRLAQPTTTPAELSPETPIKASEATAALPTFRWPVRGKVITSYGAKTNGKANDGINLAVPEGTPVKAAEDGVVAYSGNELKGYGNLVLVRHSNGYVTAYAHASELLVKRGDTIKRGQIIAKSGQSGEVGSPQLHFEIRKGSSPVDPLQFLNGA